MPFGPFAKRFSPKKPVARKASSVSTLQSLDREALQRELNANDSVKKIRINLDGNKIVFDENGWVSETLSSEFSQKELHQVKKANDKLREENNLLKLKLEISLDMLTKSTAEQHLQANEIEELKSMIRSKSATKGY